MVWWEVGEEGLPTTQKNPPPPSPLGNGLWIHSYVHVWLCPPIVDVTVTEIDIQVRLGWIFLQNKIFWDIGDDKWNSPLSTMIATRAITTTMGPTSVGNLITGTNTISPFLIALVLSIPHPESTFTMVVQCGIVSCLFLF